MEIKIVTENKKQFIDLLLLADESELMLDKYLERGDLFALYDGEFDELRSVCVVTNESADICELKNIATYEKHHGMGYGSKLIQYITNFYKDKYKTMIVGTGDIPKSIRFYERNGFCPSHKATSANPDSHRQFRIN